MKAYYHNRPRVWRQTLWNWVQLVRLDKPIGIYLLLWPTLMALWLSSNGHPSLKNLIIFSLGTILMRSAGCAINDWADRDFDGHVERTQNRPLAKGAMSGKAALVIFAVLILFSFFLVCLTNWATIKLSIICLLLATLYPFMKRYTHFPQVVLGAAYAWSIPMVYSAAEHPINLDCILLYAASLAWTVAYDTQYAMADKPDDIKIGVKSTAIFLGRFDKLLIVSMQAFAMTLWVSIGWKLNLNIAYYAGISIAIILMIYQYQLIRFRDRGNCIKAFKNNHWVGMALFLGMAIALFRI